MFWKCFGSISSTSQSHLSIRFCPPKQELWGLNAPLLIGIVASKPLFPLSLDFSSLSFILIPYSQQLSNGLVL
jgi:hypothetical protein